MELLIMDRKTELEVAISNYRIETLAHLIGLDFDKWDVSAIRFSMKNGFRLIYRHTTNNYSKLNYQFHEEVKGHDRSTTVDFKFDGSTVSLSGTIIKTYCRSDDSKLVLFIEDILLDIDADRHEEWITGLQNNHDIPEWLLIKTIVAINKIGYEKFINYFTLD